MSKKVSQWLDALGLSQYTDSFTENEVGFSLLSELSDADLKEMGVRALGHRKTLLKAIAKLRRVAADAPRTGQERIQSGHEDITAWSRTPGERKPVTMLFADIVGSTALTEKLDAEEAHELLYRATAKMCQAIENNQGTVCRLMGDGVMAMFGAPLASERHALEACQAALGVQASISRYAKKLEQDHDARIEIRVGLHSGEVVVLDVGDDPDKPEFDASGPTVALAARMEQSAPASSILITETTRALADRWIETSDHHAITAKGFSKPVTVFMLRKIRSANEPADIGRLRPIVGRVFELAQFRGLLQACIESGYGQSVLIRGEPGIGKTRLVEELMLLAEKEGYASYLALVLDFGTGKGQAAIPSLVRGLLGIAPGSGKTRRARALGEAEKAGITEPAQRVFLNDLLDLRQPLELRTLYHAMEARTRIEAKHRVVGHMIRQLANPGLPYLPDLDHG
jgi:class 3 adenylate cyclase